MTDFPAAHSMDTGWYAVDRDGHVARCFSGEVGPVPDDASRPDWSDVYIELVAVRLVAARDREAADATEHALLAQIIDGDVAAREIHADHRERRGLARGGWAPDARAIYTVDREGFVVTAREALGDYLEGIFVFAYEDDVTSSWRWKQLDARYDVPFAMVGQLERAAFDELWDTGAIVQAFLVWDIPEPHELGLYEFHHDWGYGPYQRDAVPATPVALADLPAPLREGLAALELRAIAFAEQEQFDPETYTRCYRWGGG